MSKYIKLYHKFILMTGDINKAFVLSIIVDKIKTEKINNICLPTGDILSYLRISESSIYRILHDLKAEKYIETYKKDKRYIRLISNEIAEIAKIDLSNPNALIIQEEK